MQARHRQLIAGGIVLFIAFTIQLKGRKQFTAEEFTDLSRGVSQQNQEIKHHQKREQGASRGETKKINPEILRIFKKANHKRSIGRYQDCIRIAHDARKKYPLNSFLYETEFHCTVDLGEDPRSIFFDYIERLNRKNPDYHEAWYNYHAYNLDNTLATKSLQKSIELDDNNYYRVQKTSKLATHQHNMGRYEDAIRSAFRFFELRSGEEAAATLDGLAYSTLGKSKRLSGNYTVKEWCSDIQRAHNIGWRMDVNDRNPDPTKCPI